VKKTPQERFWARVVKTDSCWNWTGCKCHGYGYFGVNGKGVRVHRFAFELLKGSIPEGKVIDHLCRNRACVNPAHLELVDQKTNNARGVGISANNARKTHCKRGHVLADIDEYTGGRYCKICRNAWARIRAEKNRRKAGIAKRNRATKPYVYTEQDIAKYS
jgi:hypothetical protein